MAALMIRRLPKKLPLILGCSLVAATCPHAVHAQLVRENTAPPQQQVSAKQDSPNPAAAQTPQGKKRLSQEVQLTGEESWIDTSIDIQAGEHVLITATGKLRYADAKDDNGPDGLPRGFKDLLRVLPFNEAGRGALIGRIGDKDTAPHRRQARKLRRHGELLDPRLRERHAAGLHHCRLGKSRR